MKRIITLLTMGLTVCTLSSNAVNQKDSIPQKNKIDLRNAYDEPTPPGSATVTYQPTRPASPLPNSIHVNRDPVVSNYTPENLVRKILLNSHTPADGQRIQNVEHSGWNWNQASRQWTQIAHVPDNNVWGKAANPGKSGVVTNYDPNERSLAYFSNGRVAGFEIDSGLLMGTGPVLMAEGPNFTNHGMNDGMTNSKATHTALQGKNAMHGIEEFPAGSFTTGGLPSAGVFYRKHQPNSSWLPNQSFDRDLDALTSDNVIWTTCGSVLEFDFQPAVGTATFDYVFASDEYPEGVYQANDVFGFFVSGPYDTPPGHDIENTAAKPSLTDPASLTEHTRTDSVYYRYNIARLPDNKPVGIDYVNWGITTALYNPLMSTPYMITTSANYDYADPYTMSATTVYTYKSSSYDPTPGIATEVNTRLGLPAGTFYSVPTNPELFKYNHVGQDMMEYDGYTVKLTAKADALAPGKWYHLKLAIAQTVQKNSSTSYVLDNNHGSSVFLANLDLGLPEASMNAPYMLAAFDRSYGQDKDGNPFLYEGCDKYVMELKFDTTAAKNKSLVEISYINMDGSAIQNLNGDKLFPKDTLRLSDKNDTVRYYPFKLSTNYKEYKNGQYVGVVITIPGGGTDTVMHSPFYTHADYTPTYYRPTVGYPGKLEIAITNGSPNLHRSMDGGENWEIASKPFTKSQIANIGEETEAFILMREPNTCYPIDTLWLSSGTGVPMMQRTVIMPQIPNATTDKYPGEHHVLSKDNFEFIIYPDASLSGKIPEISTSRKLIPDSEGILISENPDGSFTVRILYIQELVEIYVDFVTSNMTLNNSAVWANNDQLYIQSEEDCVANIYTISGELYKSVTVVSGETNIIKLSQGMYIVKMNDDKNHKIIIK